MAGTTAANLLDQKRLATIADGLVVAIGVSLPWSTSATSILLVVWLVVLIPTLQPTELRLELTTAAGGLPVLLVLLGLLGMAWADVSLADRLGGLDGFVKVLLIPLLMVQFRRSDKGRLVFIGFLIACIVLLIASSFVGRAPVKSYIAQSDEFTVCAAALAGIAAERLRAKNWLQAAALLILACAFLANMFFVTTSRTTLFIISALIVVYGVRQFGRRGLLGAAVIWLVLAGVVWTVSPYLRGRVESIYSQAQSYLAEGELTSAGLRIDYWTKSLGFIESAPLFGHGTGSITEMFTRASDGDSRQISSNPHNQTFTVAIQVGLIGALILWAMWISQLMLFRGPGLTAWIGLVFVVQNVVGSLFNSFMSDFTEGWLYVLGVGVAGGMIRRQWDALPRRPEN